MLLNAHLLLIQKHTYGDPRYYSQTRSCHGLNFLTNPARQLALRVMPASWLDLQLSYLNSLTKALVLKLKLVSILRTCVMLPICACTQPKLSLRKLSIIRCQGCWHRTPATALNVLYEWFHNAHNVYQLHSSANARGICPPGLKTRDRWSRGSGGDGDRPLTQRTVSYSLPP